MSWSLAAGFFPAQYDGLSTTTYWVMGIVGALGLFASVVLHELGHALVARRYDLPIRRIVLFIFGGVAQMEHEPKSPRAEFLVAIGGPIVSLVLGLFFLGSQSAFATGNSTSAAVGVLAYLGVINLVVVGFNLVPAFPLDGGRMLRSAVWAWKGDLAKATKITSTIGSGFAFVLVGLGVLSILAGNFVGGLWWGLLGLFLHGAARMSYQNLMVRRALEGEPLSRFMSRSPVTVSPSTNVSDFVEDYVYQHHYKLYPVVEDDELVGCVTVKDVKDVPREDRDARKVADVMSSCDQGNTIESDQDAMEALTAMHRNQSSRMIVVDDENRLVGVLALKDLMRFLAIKTDLEPAT